MGEATTFSFFLSLKADGFGHVDGGDVATRVDLTCCFVGVAVASNVATDGNPFVCDGEESGDFDNRELGSLGNVSREVEFERSLVGLMARAFCVIPFGTGGGEGFMAGIATKEATGGSTGGREGEGSLLCHFEAEAAAFGSSEDLFFDELPPQVFTMTLGQNRA